VSGMILHPRFYQVMSGNRAEERRKLGLDPRLPVGLVLFGGYGSRSWSVSQGAWRSLSRRRNLFFFAAEIAIFSNR
jgi:hypothetical protein